ncbi:DUF2953 domain-containing protein [Bacillus changyiensis]|uniref:DUF2953 domain-containing protein n=1 Tax=Bacillus changyiensis TaxID=3004103 RepID=UPI0022E3E3F1|nr:DUF2953 domain-containing protein [Bacillus changyiensis]MDA1477613.1 DUF2953 domain-containing protein [Bacillus changyiensis]
MIYIWIAGVLLLLTAVMMMKVQFAVEYLHTNENDELTVQMRTAFGLFRMKKKVPLIKVNQEDMTIDLKQQTNTTLQEDEEKSKIGHDQLINRLHDLKKITEQIINVKLIFRKFMKRIHITELKWMTVLGFSDAALTGIVTGGVWSVKACVMALFDQLFSFKKRPEYQIIPVFNNKVSQTQLTCIFYFRLGHAIIAAFRIVMNRKGKMRGFMKLPKNVSGSTKNDSSV